MASTLIQAVRGLRRSPVFSCIAILSLALGIGVTVSIVTAAHQLLWKPLPYEEPSRLAAVFETDPSGVRTGVALANREDFRNGESFEAIACYSRRTFGLRSESDRAQVIAVGQITSDFFDVLGIDPVRGRSFTEDEELSEARVIVLSYELWTSRFGADPELVGKTVLLNELPRTVLGILPEGFRFRVGGGFPSSAYIPLSHGAYGNKRAVRTLTSIGRLRPGLSFDSARLELDAIAMELATRFPDTNAGFSATLSPLRDVLAGENRRPLELLSAAAIVILLIVATNIGGLLTARFAARGREVGIRLSMGAGTRHLLTAYMMEGLLLGLAGAAGGLLIAQFVLESLPALLPLLSGFASDELGLEAASLLAGLAAALATVVVFSLFPLWLATRSELPALLRSGTFTNAPAFRVRRMLVIAQIGLGLLTLQTALLLGQSLFRLVSVNPGFEARYALTFGIGLPEARYDTGAKLLGFHRRLIPELEAIPGVESVGAGTGRQLAGNLRNRIGFRGEGESMPRLEWPSALVRLASPGYFRALAIPVLRGRAFAWSDDVDNVRVIIVNRAFERTYFAREAAIGRRVELSWATPANPSGSVFEIVGVVADTRQLSLRDDPMPEIVLPMTQFPTETEGAVYTIRSERTDSGLPQSIRDGVDAIDGTLEAIQVRPVTRWVEQSVSEERLSLLLAGLVGGTALLLAALGIYGVLAYFVLRRRREIAIRMALGARSRELARLVLAEATRLTMLGCLLGFAGFAILGPAMKSQLFGVELLDGVSTGVAVLTLAAVAILASTVPSRSALRTPPMEVLREE